MNNKKLIRLTEADLHRIVRESVNNVLNEIGDTYTGQYQLGRLAARNGDMYKGMPRDNSKDIEYYANDNDVFGIKRGAFYQGRSDQNFNSKNINPSLKKYRELDDKDRDMRTKYTPYDTSNPESRFSRPYQGA